jgi:RimJ/RimL family protein N-acetyltransferase
MCASDASALLEIYGDPVVMKYTDEKPFPDLGTVFLMLQSVQTLLSSGESLEWAIVPVDGEGVIGTCGLHTFNESFDTAEVGCLLRQSSWGNGYMKDAINLLKVYARETLGLSRLMADVHLDNKRARQLFKALGFRQHSPELWTFELIDQSHEPKSAVFAITRS